MRNPALLLSADLLASAAEDPKLQAILDAAVPQLIYHEAGRALAIAAVAWFFWDMLVTLDDEIRFIWLSKPRVSFLKILFYINRYFVMFSLIIHTIVIFAVNPTTKTCDIANDFFTYGTIVNVATTEIMVMMRVWILYHKEKRVLIFLLTLYTTAVIITLVVLSIGTTQAPDIVSIAPRFVSCARSLPPYFGSPFLVTLIDQTIFFIMTYSKSYQHVKSQAKTPILSALVREGLIYYIISLWSIALMITGSFWPPLGAPAYSSYFVNVAFSVTGSRLTLSLRSISFEPQNGTSVFTKNRSRITTADLPEFTPADMVEEGQPEDSIPLRTME